MEDLVKALATAPVNAVLLLAGIAFLAVAVFGRITDRLDPGPKGRILAGGLGVVLVAVGLYLSTSDERREAAPAVAPAKEQPQTAGSTATSVAVGASPPAQPASTPATPGTTPTAPASDSYPIAVAGGQVVKGEDRTYTVSEIALDRHGIDERGLAITVRMQNDADYPANFWNESFRLMVDGALRAPSGDLNEVVPAHASMDGTVNFVLPSGARQVLLQIDRFGAEAAGIAIALPAER